MPYMKKYKSIINNSAAEPRFDSISLTPIDGAISSPTTADLSSSTLAENDDELPVETSAF